jgi:hypothetical protein
MFGETLDAEQRLRRVHGHFDDANTAVQQRRCDLQHHFGLHAPQYRDDARSTRIE